MHNVEEPPNLGCSTLLTPYPALEVHPDLHVVRMHSPFVIVNVEFTSGDPHFQSVDRKNFTFNGIGEYIFVRTPDSLGFNVQGRLQAFSESVMGTVVSSIVVKQGATPPVQVSVENNELKVYVGGVEQELGVGGVPIIINEGGVVPNGIPTAGGGGGGGVGGGMAGMMADQVIMMMENIDSIVVSTTEGASVIASLQNGFLGIAVSLPQTFNGSQTSGLLGVFNGDPDDDFRNREGDILNPENEEEIYTQFGLLCK